MKINEATDFLKSNLINVNEKSEAGVGTSIGLSMGGGYWNDNRNHHWCDNGRRSEKTEKSIEN